jgi:hypothetical protein
MTSAWGTYLVEKKIIYVDEKGCYRWKNDIEVTLNLINDFRNYVKLKDKLRKQNPNNKIVKKPYQKTNNKYYNFLLDFKTRTYSNNISSLTEFLAKQKMNKAFGTFLIKNNIIYKDQNGFYKWNEKFTLSMDLIDKYRNQYKPVYTYYNKAKQNKQQLETQPELQFDMNYIEIPAEIKAKARAESKTRTTKVKVQEPINIPTQQNEYGLIRKFLKLIWTFLKWLW